MYAILDIETTGGQFNEEGITEIAIYKFDGHEIVDQFISLVNPEIPIQPFVVKLTGINNAMLQSVLLKLQMIAFWLPIMPLLIIEY
jgi:DNA polymerase-3 subunit epsilon